MQGIRGGTQCISFSRCVPSSRKVLVLSIAIVKWETRREYMANMSTFWWPPVFPYLPQIAPSESLFISYNDNKPPSKVGMPMFGSSKEISANKLLQSSCCRDERISIVITLLSLDVNTNLPQRTEIPFPPQWVRKVCCRTRPEWTCSSGAWAPLWAESRSWRMWAEWWGGERCLLSWGPVVCISKCRWVISKHIDETFLTWMLMRNLARKLIWGILANLAHYLGRNGKDNAVEHLDGPGPTPHWNHHHQRWANQQAAPEEYWVLTARRHLLHQPHSQTDSQGDAHKSCTPEISVAFGARKACTSGVLSALNFAVFL